MIGLFWLTILAVLLVVGFHSAYQQIDKWLGPVGGQVTVGGSEPVEVKPLELHSEGNQ